MNVLIVGGNTTNKGAYLMLLATKKLASKIFPTAKFVLPPSVVGKQILDEEGFKLLDYPLFHVGHDRWFKLGLKYPLLTKLIFKYGKKHSLSGTIKLNEIDVVLDVSGFAFGNKFGRLPIINLKKQIDFFKSMEIPYVVMPQALGPFSAELEPLASAAFSAADLVYARDRISFENLRNLNIEKDKCFQAYDITLALDSDQVLPKRLHEFQPYCTIVPNVRMIDKADQSWRKNYESAITDSIKLILQNSKKNILILVHSTSTGGDATLSEKIYQTFKTEPRVRLDTDENPLVLKRILKESDFLIGSRFHALASALSSSTPSLATSWLHKYEMLFEDYGVSELSHNKFDKTFSENILKLCDDSFLDATKAILEEKNVKIKKANDNLWNSIKGVHENSSKTIPSNPPT